MLTTLTTNFIGRLKRNDEAAWFELWETFGPVIRGAARQVGQGPHRLADGSGPFPGNDGGAVRFDRSLRPVARGPVLNMAAGDRQARPGR